MTPDVLADDCFLLLGNPVDHSLSPLIQNAAFKQAGFSYRYESFQCERSDLRLIIRRLSESGLGGNVTLPHKESVVDIIDKPFEAVLKTGACNTFWSKEGEVYGDNTDVEGFRRACHLFLGNPPRDLNVLVLGAGGVVRAVIMSLLNDEVGEITILNRSLSRAKKVADHFDSTKIRIVDRGENIKGREFDLIINGTSLGLRSEDPNPIDLDLVSGLTGVMDLVYGKETTELVRAAKERGLQAVDGTEMLLQQAAVSFELWWEKPAPVDTMRRTLEDVLLR